MQFTLSIEVKKKFDHINWFKFNRTYFEYDNALYLVKVIFIHNQEKYTQVKIEISRMYLDCTSNKKQIAFDEIVAYARLIHLFSMDGKGLMTWSGKETNNLIKRIEKVLKQ